MLERFTVLFMTIVDYLEIDDRLLLHSDDDSVKQDQYSKECSG